MILVTDLPGTITIPDANDHEVNFEILPDGEAQIYVTVISGTPKMSINKSALTSSSTYAAGDKEIITVSRGMKLHVSGSAAVVRFSA